MSINKLLLQAAGSTTGPGFGEGDPFDGWDGWNSFWFGGNASAYYNGTSTYYGNTYGGSYKSSFSSNGLIYYNSSEAGIYQWILSTPYNLATASLNYTFTDAKTTFITSHFFNKNGTKVVVYAPGQIVSYDLNTPWDLETFTNKKTYTGTIAPNTSTGGIAMHPNGDRLYLCLRFGAPTTIREFSLTPGDASTIQIVKDTVISGGASTWYGIQFDGVGSKVYLGDRDGRNIYTYSLSSPYDLTTASLVETQASWAADTWGIDFTHDGDVLWLGQGTGSAGPIIAYEK